MNEYMLTFTRKEADQIGRALTLGFPRTKPLWDKLKAQCEIQEAAEMTRFEKICADVEETLREGAKKLVKLTGMT